MRPFIGIATFLYPAEWRRRYGVEFQCLLEDANPKWRDVVDVLKGGLQMRLTGATRVQLMVIWALIGAVPALILSLRLPDLYRGESLMMVYDAGTKAPASIDQVSGLTKRSLNNDHLTRVMKTYEIQDNGVRPSGLAAFAKVVLFLNHPPQSLQESVDQMRSDLKVEVIGSRPGLMRLTFTSNKAPIAAQITNQLAALMIEDTLKPGEPLKLVILNPARIPAKPFFPFRAAILALGTFAGALLGLILSLFRPRPLQLAS